MTIESIIFLKEVEMIVVVLWWKIPLISTYQSAFFRDVVAKNSLVTDNVSTE